MAAEDRTAAPFTIGQFSRITALSVRMLRYYDEHGVLEPDLVDPETGYRFYSPSQLRDAGRVRTLRDLGFGVAAIAGLLSADAETLARALSIHRSDLVPDARRATERLAALDGLVASLKEHPMSIDFTRTTHPAQTVISLRRVIPSYADEPVLWDEMMRLLSPDALAAFNGHCMAIFHDEDYRETDVDVEIAQPVSRPLDVPEPLHCVERPAQEVVVGTLLGSYDQMPDATAAAGAWIASHGLTMTGGMYCRYLVAPVQTSNPAEWVTEVCINIADQDAVS